MTTTIRLPALDPATGKITAQEIPTGLVNGIDQATADGRYVHQDGTGLPPSVQGLVATAVKSTNYSAVAADFVPVDASGGPVIVTLPSAPVDGSRIGVKIVAQAATPNLVTINAAGSDHFNKAGGSVSMTLAAQFQAVILQYQASTGLWFAQSTDAPLGVASGAAKLGTDATVGGPGGTGFTAAVVKSAGGGTLGNYPRDNADGTWSWTQLRPTVALGSPGASSSVALIAQIERKATLTLTADHVMTVTNLVDGAVLWVEATQDATGGRTLSISDGSSTEMVPISTPAAKTSLVAVMCDGTNLFVEQVS